jgi:hypothetical protein
MRLLKFQQPEQKALNLGKDHPETIALGTKATWLLTRKDFSPSVEVVTPRLAKELLTRNVSNRPALKPVIASYAAAMRAEAWKLNGESIVISDAGLIRDGQHRLMAVVEAGVDVPMFFTSGVDDNTYRTLNTGRSRTASNVLSIEGFRYATTIAGGLREYYAYKKGFTTTSGLTGINSISNEILYEHAIDFGKDRLETIACTAANYWHQNRFLSPSQIFAFILALDEIPGSRWVEFMDRIFHGVGVEKKSPEFLFISRTRKEGMSPTQKTPPIIRRALFIKAYNAFILRKQMGTLKFDPAIEKYPRFIGDIPPVK